MTDQAMNALVATGLGTIAAIILLVPTAAYQYRLDGKLQPRDLAILLSGAIYGLALWTYTLLPMPADHHFRCKRAVLDPMHSLRGLTGGGVGLVHNAAFLQIALNVLLFVPMGYYVRQILGRGVVVATGLGFATSLLIEMTQKTGVWHLYHCAYRQFDVDDLVVNTLGALFGSLLAALFVRRRRGPIVLPTRITLGRRLVGLLSDVLFVVLVGGGTAVAYNAWFVYGPGGHPDPDVRQTLQVAVPGAVELAIVLLAGRTVGEWVISVRTVLVGPLPLPTARSVKLAMGIGPAIALLGVDTDLSAFALVGWLILTAVAVVPTKQHRGLSHVASGLELAIAKPGD
ncbi:VanZ family protein [Nocardioides montaniterrae]